MTQVWSCKHDWGAFQIPENSHEYGNFEYVHRIFDAPLQSLLTRDLATWGAIDASYMSVLLQRGTSQLHLTVADASW